MDILQHIRDSKNLSHAYILRTTNTSFPTELKSYIAEHLLKQQGSPDIYSVQYETLSVDEARALTQYASLRPLSGKKYILIAAQQITPEAQNALLKVVEEGSGHSTFFFVVGSGVAILPTLMSRCVVLKDDTIESDGEQLGKEFLQLTYKERLARAEKFGKDSDREGARALVRSLLALSDKKKFDKKKLRDLLEADQYLKLSGSSPKGVIGHLSLIL